MIDEGKMFQEERIIRMVEYIKQKGRATVEELSEEFHVSPVTVRRDLILIERRFDIRRTHGGAMSLITENSEFAFEEKYRQNISLKKRIAEKAIDYIKDKTVISFDGGSTNYFIARELDKFSQLKIITNSIPISYLLKDSNHDLIIAGGNIRKKSMSVVGPLVNDFIEKFNIDVCFIGATGISPDGSLYSPNELEAATKQVFLKSSVFKILVADHTKISMRSFAKFGNVNDFDLFITTKEINSEDLDKLQKIKNNLVVV